MEGSVNKSGVEVPSRVGEGNVGYGVGGRRVVVSNDTVGRSCTLGVAVGTALRVSARAVLTVDMAVSIRSVGLSVAVDRKLLQDASIPAARNKIVIVPLKIFIFVHL
jgi:hypothetical protein